MSFHTLELMRENRESEDMSLEQYTESQTKRRAVVLPEAEIVEKATALYARVTERFVIVKNTNRMRRGFSSIPLATHPECIVQRVIKLLADKGVKAKHCCNEHTPRYDHLEIDLNTLPLGL